MRPALPRLAVAVVLAAAAGVIGTTAVPPPPAVRSPSDPGPLASRRAAAPSAGLFAGMLLVYGSDALTRTQVDALATAAHTAVVVPVYARQLNVASGRPDFPDIPVAAITVDPPSYARAVGRPELAPVLAAGAVLSSTEARLRHATAGSRLTLSSGRHIQVSAVVDDHVLGGQELAVPRSLGLVPTATADYVIVAHGGHPAWTARVIRAALPRLPLRIRSATANGYFSSADSVLTQLQVKMRFGEFAMRRTGGSGLVPDPTWVTEHLVSARIPQLGSVTCNRGVIRALRAAMTEVTDRGLGSTVHTADFQYEGGCWNPNIVPGVAGTISRHTWGLAVDINVDTNPFGERPHQDARLVSVMRRHGFTWGGTWLRPDAMHFEYVGP